MAPCWKSDDMRDRLDPLIAERAAWLTAPWAAPARRVLDRMLSYDRSCEIGEGLRHAPTPELMGVLADMIARDVEVEGIHRIPKDGAAIVVANHPTGIADGIVLWSLVAPIRPDLFIYTNSDVLRVMPQMEDLIVPVEWREEKRTVAATRATMAATRKALKENRLGVIFPSGRLAKRRGLRLYERPWMHSAAALARKYDLPVIPLHIRARNSALFYLFDRIHPSLRDITLFHETLNKDRQPFRVRVGQPIAAADLPTSADDATEILRRATLGLGDEGVGLWEMTGPPFRRPRGIVERRA